MIGSRLTTLTLFGFARPVWADKTVGGIIFGILWLDLFTRRILLGSIPCISLLELKLQFTFAAINQVAHFADSLVLKSFETLVTHNTFKLVFHHDCRTSWLETFEVSSLINEFSVNILVDTGHAKDVPAIVYVKKNISVKIFIVFAIALSTSDNFCFVHIEFRVFYWFLHDLSLHLRLFCSTFGIKIFKYFTERSFPSVLAITGTRAEGIELFQRKLYLLTEELGALKCTLIMFGGAF